MSKKTYNSVLLLKKCQISNLLELASIGGCTTMLTLMQTSQQHNYKYAHAISINRDLQATSQNCLTQLTNSLPIELSIASCAFCMPSMNSYSSGLILWPLW